MHYANTRAKTDYALSTNIHVSLSKPQPHHMVCIL